MTAYELRKHLATNHNLNLRGSSHEALTRIHNMDHQNAPDHNHDTEPPHRTDAA